MIIAYEVEGAGWKLSVSDNGVGRSDGHEGTRNGLGTSLVEALAHQLDAGVEISSGSHGTIVSVIHAR